MLTCPPSNVPLTLLLHWGNQSYNTACNYANRSGAEQSFSQTMQAYVLATSSACGLAYGLGQVFSRAPPSIKRFGIIIPCLATAAANVSNVGFTRMSEITQGTQVRDAAGVEIGMSRIAGYECVKQTAITRCVLVPCACLLLPPIATTALASVGLIPTLAASKLLLEMGIIYGSLQAALPAALAVYPPVAAFDVATLEPKFQNIEDKGGQRIRVLYANKGL